MSKNAFEKESEALADQAARDRIRDDLDTTLVVEAAAGTGKTSALIGRILSAIISGRVSLAEIVAVTFTEHAAGELKLRLRSAIEQARHQVDVTAEASKFLTQAVRELEEARIGTIHSFCSDLLREHPVEVGIDPLFEVAPDDVTYPLFDLAFERWFEKQLANPGEGVRRILRRTQRREFGSGRSATLARRPRESGPKPILRSAAWELVKERDFTAPWKQVDDFNRDADIDQLILEMKELGDWSEVGQPDQWLTKSLAYVKRFVSEITRVESLGEPRDYDGIEARMFGFLGGWGRAKDWKAYFAKDSFPADELRDRRDQLKVRVQEFIARTGADLAPRLREELWQVVEDFEQLKERDGYLDFLDLLLRARNLVRDNRDIRVELQRHFTHIFVDEFQDTDPLQAEILMLLAADDPDQNDWRQVQPVPGKLFIVGDPKQSIYRFRRADVALYQEVKRQVVTSGGALIDLNVSFRAVPEIQAAVNAAFAPVMTESLTQAHYVPLAPCRIGPETQPSIIALPVSQPYGDYGKTVDKKIDESLPGDVAAFINWLVNESGWTVTERGSEDRVPLRARHICLLFRRLRHYSTDVTRGYVQALEAHRLPHLLVGGSSFHAREEIEAIRNALTAIEWPEDELAVFATLRGSLFGFTDAQLLAYRGICSTFHTFKEPPDDLPESLAEVVDAMAILRELHRQRNRCPIAETIQKLLALTRAHAGFAHWPTGEQALANLMRLTDMARRAERNGLISFRSFVDWLDEQAESGDVGDAPIMEEGVDGVRIMTVHKAKGLEFPVVFLVDITAKDTREPSKWIDQRAKLSAIRLAGCTPIEVQEHAEDEARIEQEEAARVLYVAATRARDLLVVSGVGDRPYDGWLATLNPILYPAETASFNPQTKQPAGCPVFGSDTVIGRPQNARRPQGSASPGLHHPKVGTHRVVWFDTSVLERPNSQTRSSSRLTAFLKEDEDKTRSQEGIRIHDAWQENRSSIRRVAAKPEWNVVTTTSYAEEPETTKSDVESAFSLDNVTVTSVATDFDRPHGKRFGTLVHAVLSLAALDSDQAELERVTRVQARIIGANDEEVAAAINTVGMALKHPLLRGAAAASSKGRCRREVHVAIDLKELMLEGVVDLAFLDDNDGDRWNVVDYKTDFELGNRLEVYKKQVSLYALAISRATGKSAQAFLLRI